MSDNFFKIKNGATFTGTTAPSNPIDGDVYYDTVQGFLGYNYGSWGPLGGGGGINYDTNPNIGSTVGYNLYNDGAVSIPTNGSGGSVTNLTFVSTDVSPIFSHTMGVLSKAAANAQGEGLSYDFTIDSAFAPGIIQISYVYKASANFALSSGLYGSNSDVEMWIYDKTNDVIIPITPNVLTAGVNNPAQFTGYFQTNANSTSYRLIWHIATTNALAWTMNMGNVVISPNQNLGMLTPQVSAIYTSSTSQGVSTLFFENKVEDTTGAVTNSASAWTFTAPYSGLYSVSAHMGLEEGTPGQAQILELLKNGTSYASDEAYASGTVVLSFIQINTKIRLAAGDTLQLEYTTGAALGTNGDPTQNFVSVTLIQSTLTGAGGYGSAAKMLAQTATSGINGSNTPVVFETVLEDNYAAYNPSTGIYTVPVSGVYLVTACVNWNQQSGYQWEMQIWINGTAIADVDTGEQNFTGSHTRSLILTRHITLAAGATVQIVNAGGTNNEVGSLIQNYLDIVQIVPPLPLPPAATSPGSFGNSASCGDFTTSSASPVDVTNLSVPISCSGASPVDMYMQNDGSGNSSGIGYAELSASFGVGFIYFLRNGTIIGKETIELATTPAGSYLIIPASSFRFTDINPPAGVNTYSIQASSNDDTLHVGNAILIVRE